MRKEELQESIHEAQAILEAQGGSSTAPARGLSDLAGAIQSFRAKIVMAGQFSAGKTALLNAFLGGEEILPENISPQTALATELVYGPEPHVIFVHKDGRQEQVSLDDARDFYEPDCLKCIYILPQEPLRQIPDLTLVDMPGFDSGIEAHNRALFHAVVFINILLK